MFQFPVWQQVINKTSLKDVSNVVFGKDSELSCFLSPKVVGSLCIWCYSALMQCLSPWKIAENLESFSDNVGQN